MSEYFIGCNYHTRWQKHPAMRFVLKEIKGSKAVLYTRSTRKEFETDIADLIFIETDYNTSKASYSQVVQYPTIKLNENT